MTRKAGASSRIAWRAKQAREVLRARLRNDFLACPVLILLPEFWREHRIGSREGGLDGLIVVAEDFRYLVTGESAEFSTRRLFPARFDALPVQPTANSTEGNDGRCEECREPAHQPAHQLPPSGHFKS